jgi:hypothetical protein
MLPPRINLFKCLVPLVSEMKHSPIIEADPDLEYLNHLICAMIFCFLKSKNIFSTKLNFNDTRSHPLVIALHDW